MATATPTDEHERAADAAIGDLLAKVDTKLGDRIHRRVAIAIAMAENRAQSRGAQSMEAELRKHQDLVEALQWLPAGTVVNFCDLDDFLQELRDKPGWLPVGWLPVRECPHTGEHARCIQCRNEED